MLAEHLTSFSGSQAHVYYRELRLVVVSDCPETMLRIYWTVGYKRLIVVVGDRDAIYQREVD